MWEGYCGVSSLLGKQYIVILTQGENNSEKTVTTAKKAVRLVQFSFIIMLVDVHIGKER